MKVAEDPPRIGLACGRAISWACALPRGRWTRSAWRKGVAELEGLGLRVRVSEGTLGRQFFTSGPVARRRDELQALFADDEVRGIVCARGGAGAGGLLPLLDPALLRDHPKALLGCSDITFLHLFLERLDLVSLHGPDGGGRPRLGLLRPGEPAARPLRRGRALRVRRPTTSKRSGPARARACCSAAASRSWPPRPARPGRSARGREGTLLFIEDVHERPFRIDRMLRQLRQAGAFAGVRGIVFGDMQGCAPKGDEGYTLEAVILDALEGLEVPVALGLSSGHTASPAVTLPLGVRARLACADGVGPARSARARARVKLHLSGICGTAMASLAGLLREQGHAVTGSDQDVYPPMSTQLEALGIPIRSPYAEANVPADADLVVIGNALSRGNPEVEVVLDRKQRMTSLPALVGEEMLRGRTSLVVAGTHGKTTTTSLLAFLLERAGQDPSFLVGGVPLDFGRSYRLGGGPHFVVEGDEYDSAFFDKRPKFVHYHPDVAIIGNVEYDHADIYPDLAAVQTAFVRLLSVVPRRGLVVAGIESPALLELLPRAFCPVETFGLAAGADWRAEDVRREGETTRFRLRVRGRDEGEFALGLAGDHNVRNALAALAAANAAGVSPAACREALAAFRGVKRRLEVRGTVRGVTVYDDFAHHPTAVRATLEALRAQRPGAGGPGGGRLVAVFEPRSFTSRTRVFQADFATAFAAADVVVVAAAHLPGKVPEAAAALGGRARPRHRGVGHAGGVRGRRSRHRGAPGREPAAGRSRGHPVERRLRRASREAAGALSAD